ncbi:MAG: VanZ family protein [Winogradskyella sp.]|uniref:VanZ family protein n=1 Tax=Winogradskyella sp. TaxID=1883156 RepID=UPI0017B8FD63|nr:VanZ family protein [Winogradskyella sp.]MBT8244987.1 VanZ family protein [Winogradskyella sp.]NNK22171.1 VanZ family protein [Winogradskyella sp.]
MLKKRQFYLFTAIGYTLFLLYITLANPEKLLVKEYLEFQDKIFHFGAYVLLALVWGFFALKAKYKKAILISFTTTLTFGVILEIIQEILNPLREYDNLDLLANCIGVAVGTIIVFYYKNLKLK